MLEKDAVSAADSMSINRSLDNKVEQQLKCDCQTKTQFGLLIANFFEVFFQKN